MPPKKPDYSKDYTQWKSIHIEVPSEFITHTKSGRISIRRPLTKTQGLSRSNKEPSIMITENSDITAPKIINQGTRTNRPPPVKKTKPAKDKYVDIAPKPYKPKYENETDDDYKKRIDKPRPKSNRKLLNAQTRNEALINKMISESKRAKDNFTENDNEMKKLKHTGKMITLPTFTKKELQDIYMKHTAYKSEEKEWAYEYLLHAMNDGLREVPDVEDNKQLKNVLKYFVALRKKLST